MEYMSAREAAGKWGISQRRVAVLCSEDRIENAQMLGNMWIIPSNAKKPEDKRKRKKSESNRKKHFQVTIEETVSDDYSVLADNIEEAKEIAIKKYRECEIVLEPGNIQGKKLIIVDLESNDTTDWIDF